MTVTLHDRQTTGIFFDKLNLD